MGLCLLYNSLIENCTWDLTSLPSGRKAVTGKWVYKVKQNQDGSISRFKSRYVARGFSQIHGIDYEETHSPVVRFTGVRTLLALAAQGGIKCHHLDVKTAFLYGKLEEDIYLVPPQGFEQYDASGNLMYCKLNKAIYGLKQASRSWNLTLCEPERDTCLTRMNHVYM